MTTMRAAVVRELGQAPVKLIPGHEGVGTVVALGEGVTDLAVGELVGNAWLWSACGDCHCCRTGWETLCEEQQSAGSSVNGSFAEYMVVAARFAARIPAGTDPIDFYLRGRIHPTMSTRRLDEINVVVDETAHGKIDGRVVSAY